MNRPTAQTGYGRILVGGLVLLTVTVAAAAIYIQQLLDLSSPAKLHRTSKFGFGYVGDQSIESWTERADVVAQVSVSQVGVEQWETESGQQPAGEERDPFSLRTFRPVVMAIDTVFKAPDTCSTTVGFVSAVIVRHTGPPAQVVMDEIGVGDRGMAFYAERSPVIRENPPPFALQPSTVAILDIADGLTAAGQRHDVMWLHNWYRYDEDKATSLIDGRTVAIADLIEEIQEAMATPTPKPWRQ